MPGDAVRRQQAGQGEGVERPPGEARQGLIDDDGGDFLFMQDGGRPLRRAADVVQDHGPARGQQLEQLRGWGPGGAQVHRGLLHGQGVPIQQLHNLAGRVGLGRGGEVGVQAGGVAGGLVFPDQRHRILSLEAPHFDHRDRGARPGRGDVADAEARGDGQVKPGLIGRAPPAGIRPAGRVRRRCPTTTDTPPCRDPAHGRCR